MGASLEDADLVVVGAHEQLRPRLAVAGLRRGDGPHVVARDGPELLGAAPVEAQHAAVAADDDQRLLDAAERAEAHAVDAVLHLLVEDVAVHLHVVDQKRRRHAHEEHVALRVRVPAVLRRLLRVAAPQRDDLARRERRVQRTAAQRRQRLVEVQRLHLRVAAPVLALLVGVVEQHLAAAPRRAGHGGLVAVEAADDAEPRLELPLQLDLEDALHAAGGARTARSGGRRDTAGAMRDAGADGQPARVRAPQTCFVDFGNMNSSS